MHIYNYKYQFLQGYTFMSNHVATDKLPTPAAINLSIIVPPVGEDWALINNDKGYITLHPGLMNVFLFPDTYKAQ